MVLDIREFRENAEVLKESQRRRGAPVEVIDQIIELDAQWRKARFAADQAAKEVGAIQKEVGMLHKSFKTAGQDASAPENAAKLAELAKRKDEADAKVVALNKAADELQVQVDKKVGTVGNIVHESVTVSMDEEQNGLVKLHGDAMNKPCPGLGFHHHELVALIDGADCERGARVAGHRGYFLKGAGLKLNMALVTYGLAFLEKRGYTCMQTPFFMRREMMARTAQLSDFDEQLYKVDEGTGGPQPGSPDEKFLIATSEQPISAFHYGEWLQPKDLPIKYAGFSTNFRKEAGAHGKDVWGIFRVHQFEKIEQFVLTDPAKSWEMHEEMIKASEEFFQSLGLSYRVVNIVSGALNNAAAKKYDLEAWFPASRLHAPQYRELVSCSNCTDYQSRSLEVRFAGKKEADGKKTYVHMLNSTLCATERALCCCLENWQTPEGIAIPEVLRPYMGGLDFIKFVKSPEAMLKEAKKPAPSAPAAAAAPAKQ